MKVECDHQGAVAVVNSGFSKIPELMHLVRCLFYIWVTYQFSLRAVYCPGKQNVLADAISRGTSFHRFQERVLGPSRAGGSVSGRVTKLDITELVLTVCELFTAGLAETTQRVYKSGIWKYKNVCELVERHLLPLSEDVLCLFVVYLYRVGVGEATVKSYLSATRYLQITSGRGDPNIGAISRLEYIIRGLKRW